ncbi:MAG TPA: glycosyltransferase family 1 protein [Anaerolineae bacterium]|nr:glycosyltransferase family 1 protein [Anaerolineae bacterium]HQK12629.1 glycosyltransferase family 1 protein [Anaerolineae bacterium]
MRVALSGWFWDYPETGTGQYLRYLTAALADVAPASRFTVLTPTPPPETVCAPNVEFITVPGKRTNVGKVWWEQVTLPRAVHRFGVDVLHVPYWAPPLYAGLPAVVTIHDLIPLLLKPYRGTLPVRMYTAFVSATASRATLLLTDSEASRRDIVAHLRVSPTRVQTVYLAVDRIYVPVRSTDETDGDDPKAHSFCFEIAAAKDAAVLAQLGVQPGYVLYLGGFDVRKNVRGMCAAFARVVQTVPDAHLVIAGKLPAEDSAFTPDPRRLAQEAGIPEGRVHFVGFVPETVKPALYRQARVFLFPSLYEGFGLPPLESLACGTPVVGSRTASLPEVVRDGGILLDPADIEGMAAALVRLLTDDAFHAELRRRALQRAARFTWETTARETFAAYEKAMKLATTRNM